MEEPAEGLPGRHGGGASCRQIKLPYHTNSCVGDCSFLPFFVVVIGCFWSMTIDHGPIRRGSTGAIAALLDDVWWL